MKCEKCGQPVEDGRRFCYGCESIMMARSKNPSNIRSRERLRPVYHGYGSWDWCPCAVVLVFAWLSFMIVFLL